MIVSTCRAAIASSRNAHCQVAPASLHGVALSNAPCLLSHNFSARCSISAWSSLLLHSGERIKIELAVHLLRQALAGSSAEDLRSAVIRLALHVLRPHCPTDHLTRYWAAGDIPGTFPRLTEATEAFHAIVRKLREARVYEG